MTTTVQPSGTARLIAMKALNQWDRSQSRAGNNTASHPPYAGQILDKLLDQTPQRQRATDLTFGTIRNRVAIDIVLAIIAETPPKRIKPDLINIIRIGIYELVYQPQTPDYSIINEAAENTKTLAGQKQVGFVNAVLRKVASNIVNRCVALSGANPRKTLLHDAYTGCEFAKCLLPDPETAAAEYFSAAFSLPAWLVKTWLDEFGPDETRNICIASNRRPSIYIRPNTLKATTYKLAERFTEAGIDYDITPDDSMIYLRSRHSVTQLPGFDEGLFTVQDLTAAAPLKALQFSPGSLILDMCAAPGTKAAQLAELTYCEARILATDIDKNRLEKLHQNIERLGHTCIEVIPYDRLHEYLAKAGQPDFILLDVPCSNTGVLARRPEVRHRLRQKAVDKLARTQAEILNSAASLIKSTGRICYVTCSILNQENAKVVADFLSDNPNFVLESQLLTLPSAERFDHDGGYYAIIKKS
jgi:16S rRNA (cytosine967-C5)-methyltransferase